MYLNKFLNQHCLNTPLTQLQIGFQAEYFFANLFVYMSSQCFYPCENKIPFQQVEKSHFLSSTVHSDVISKSFAQVLVAMESFLWFKFAAFWALYVVS